MPCIVALIIFGIMGIFSASQRALAREAFDCVFRRVTFRPCNTGFQEKIKGKLLARVLSRSTFWAKVLNKYYEVFSWIFFILFIGSTVWVLRGAYNFYVYGSCNGLNQSGFCAFDPKGENNETSGLNKKETCGITKDDATNLTLENTDLSLFPSKNSDSENNLVFIGCYACDFSRKTYPLIQELLKKEKINYTFAHYPAKGDTTFLGEVGYCVEQQYGDQFWDFNDYLFTADKDYVLNKDNISEILKKFNFDVQKINQCAQDLKTKTVVEGRVQELDKTNIYGTPTVFIDGKAFVGPKPYRVYRSAINKFIFF